jgi:signal transduction histidine kinase
MASGTHKKSLRVLLVEDSDDDAELILRHLRRGDLAPIHGQAATAEAFERALDTGVWDVVLADCTLARFSAAEALQRLHARGMDIPFIIVSGTAGEEVAVAMIKAGAQDFFVKGDLKRLAASVEREVQGARLRRQRALERRRADDDRQRLLRELKDAVQARDTFLTMAAHELRTPLMSLQLQLERLRRTQPPTTNVPRSDPAAASSLSAIGRQVVKLGELVDNLVDVSRITSGRMPLSRESVELGGLVAEVLVDLQELVHRSGSSVAVHATELVVGRWNRLRL